jgi:hypothetical protein
MTRRNEQGEQEEPEIRLFSSDEESDIEVYQEYLSHLSPEALWEVGGHLDAENYPRRYEAVQHEIARRRLLFVSPYTPCEAGLRRLYTFCLGFAGLAALLRCISTLARPLTSGEPVSFVQGLAFGGPDAAQLLLPLIRAIGVALAVFSGGWLVRALLALPKGRVCPEIPYVGLAAWLLSVALLFYAFRG